MNRATDVAWAAGLFEGEGSITYRSIRDTSRKSRGLRMLLTDEDVLRRFHEVVGVGKVHGPFHRNPKHKPHWRWHATNWRDTKHVLDLILPYLGERRGAKARELLSDPPRT